MVRQERYNEQEWYNHFFDDLGSVSKIEDKQRRLEVQFAN